MNGHFPLGDVNPLVYFLGLASVLGVLFALVSTPDEMPMWLALFQWQLQTVLPMSFLLLSYVSLSRSNRFITSNPWAKVLLAGIVGSTLFSPLALAIDVWIMGEGTPNNWLIEWADEWISVTIPVTVSWLVMNLPWLINRPYVKTTLDDGPNESSNDKLSGLTEPNDSPPAFITLLPQEKRGRILYLQAELHYLNVHTNAGSTLILYALKKAIEELPHNQGIQTHRAYWVAFDAIESYKKQGRQGELTLIDGQKVPISRTQLQQVITAWESSKLR